MLRHYDQSLVPVPEPMPMCIFGSEAQRERFFDAAHRDEVALVERDAKERLDGPLLYERFHGSVRERRDVVVSILQA